MVLCNRVKRGQKYCPLVVVGALTFLAYNIAYSAHARQRCAVVHHPCLGICLHPDGLAVLSREGR